MVVSLSLYASHDTRFSNRDAYQDRTKDKNLVVVFMQNSKLLLQQKIDNRWSTISSYCGEGGVPNNIARAVISDTSIYVTNIYQIGNIPVVNGVTPQQFYVAKLPNATDRMDRYCRNAVKMASQGGWKEFAEVDIPYNYMDNPYLNKQLLTAVVKAYKNSQYCEISKDDGRSTWDSY